MHLRSGLVAVRTVALQHLGNASGARMFCVVNGNLTGAQTAACYVNNLKAITAAAQQPGPFIYGVYEDHIERLAL